MSLQDMVVEIVLVVCIAVAEVFAVVGRDIGAVAVAEVGFDVQKLKVGAGTLSNSMGQAIGNSWAKNFCHFSSNLKMSLAVWPFFPIDFSLFPTIYLSYSVARLF
jgi:hypothetical protein